MATYYRLIPKNPSFNQLDIFESTLKILCLTQKANFEKIEPGLFNISLKSDNNTGFGLDWSTDTPSDWQKGFNPETEKPSGPEFLITTHGPSVQFVISFLKQLVRELNNKKLTFNLYDPQESEFII